MCRVIVTNHKDFNLYNKKYGVLRLFNHLEKECGGQGNGYALIKDGKIIESRKGVRLTNEEIYKRIYRMNWDWLIYHTRICSMGGKADTDCHPYVLDNDCLAMNGTEYGLRTISHAFARTDTEVIFRNMIGMGVSAVTKALLTFSSVFVGCASGVPFAVKAGGTLHRWNKGDKTFHASTFPTGTASVESLPVGYMWENGKENRQFVKASQSYGLGAYGYGGSFYGSKYYDYDDGCYYSTQPKTYIATGDVAKKEEPKKEEAKKAAAPKEPIKLEEVVSAKPELKMKPKKEDRSADQIDEDFARRNEVLLYNSNKMFSTGYDLGYEDGLEGASTMNGDDYDDGYEEGYVAGYNDGINGEESEYAMMGSLIERRKPDQAEDYNKGFEDGRAAGYDEGYEDAQKKKLVGSKD